jgi:hypothetical protein
MMHSNEDLKWGGFHISAWPILDFRGNAIYDENHSELWLGILLDSGSWLIPNLGTSALVVLEVSLPIVWLWDWLSFEDATAICA